MEAKRAADQMEDTITVGPGAQDAMRKRQARDVSYPRAGGSATGPAGPRVSFAEDNDELIMQEPAASAEQSESEDEEEEETPLVKKTARRASRKTGTQRARRVPMKLRAEAQPEKMVDKILDQPIERITMRELLGLTPDLLHEIWGVRRLPPLNKATIPSTQATKTEPEREAGVIHAGGVPLCSQMETKSMRELYVCALPTIIGKLEGRFRVTMLIDSGSQMNVMSKELWEKVQDLLPIDTDVSWSIGSGNLTHNRVYGVCHSVMVDIGGVEITGPVFVLEGAAQQFILGRPWERSARAQYDNRDNGSLYISIKPADGKRRAVFCAVAEHNSRNRDRVRTLHLIQDRENESLDENRGISGKAGCRYIRLLDEEDYDCDQGGENEHHSSKRHMLVGAAMKVEDGGMAECAIAVRAMGQPSFKGGEGAKELKKMVRQLWWARREQEVRRRIAGREAKQRMLYMRKGVKVVLVDKAHREGIKPAGEEGWRERLVGLEGERNGVLIPKFSQIPKGERLTPALIENLKLGEHLRHPQKQLLIEMLFHREAAIAFNSSEKGRFHDFIEPPHVIPTIPHKAWQAASFRIAPALRETSVRLIEDCLSCGTIERSFGPYRNPWCLVEKPGYEKNESGKLVVDSAGKPIKRYRLINTAQRINAVSIRDASLPSAVEEFSERFAGYPVVSLVDLFSGYDQCTLDPVSRDITSFHTPLGVMRMTTPPMGYTNTVQVFDRVMRKVLHHQITRGRCEPFLDDIAAKPPSRSTYPDPITGLPKESTIPGVRLDILKAIQGLDEVIADIERAGGMISGPKSAIICEGLRIVAFVCDSEGRHPDMEKVRKIVEWPACRSITEARAFIGICVYYRAWIQDFSVVAEPIFRLFHSGKGSASTTDANTKTKARKRRIVAEELVWSGDQARAMRKLKEALISALALKPLVYTPEEDGFVGGIVLGVDACGLGFGAILQQEDREQRRHPVRYESGRWTPAETRYDAVKLECRG